MGYCIIKWCCCLVKSKWSCYSSWYSVTQSQAAWNHHMEISTAKIAGLNYRELGGWFNMKICLCCLHNGISYTGNMPSLYWIRQGPGGWFNIRTTYSRVSNNSVDTLIKTVLDFPWWLASLIPPRLLKFSKFFILYIPTDAILLCLTRYRATRSFVRLFWRILPVLTVRESPSNQ